DSCASFQNDGISVANSVVGVAFLSVAGKRTFVVNVPWTVSPFVEIALPWPVWTSCRKNGLNGTVTRGWPEDGWKSRTDTQLTVIRISTNHRKPGRRCAGGPLGACSGMPRPSGAGATCQPRLSRGIGGGVSGGPVLGGPGAGGGG